MEKTNVTRILEQKKLDFTPHFYGNGEVADGEEIADYAADAIKALFEAGIINGKGENQFEPQGSATRAEAAKIIYEAFKGGF